MSKNRDEKHENWRKNLAPEPRTMGGEENNYSHSLQGAWEEQVLEEEASGLGAVVIGIGLVLLGVAVTLGTYYWLPGEWYIVGVGPIAWGGWMLLRKLLDRFPSL